MSDLGRAAREFADKNWAWLLGAVMALAAVLRFTELGAQSLWNDELSTVVFTNGGVLRAVVKAASDTGPPLYYLLQSMVNSAFGVSEVGMRFLPAFFGTLSVYVTYLVGRRLYGRHLGLGAAFVMAFSRLPLTYSQEARSYALAVLASLLVAWTLLLAIERPSAGRLALHSAVIVVAAYTHLFALVAAGGIVLGTMLRPKLVRRLSWGWAAALGVAALAFTPWLMVLVGQVRKVASISSGGQWVLKPPADIFGSLIAALSAYTPWGQKNALFTSVFLALVAIGALAAVDFARRSGAINVAEDSAASEGAADAGAFSAEPDGRMRDIGAADRLALLGGWVGAVFVGGLVVSKYVLPIFDVRMGLVAAPALYLLACNGLTKFWRPAAIAVAIAFLLYTGVGLRYYYTHPRKEQWREATQYLIEKNARRDGVIAFNSFMAKNIDVYAKILGQPQSMEAVRISVAESPAHIAEQVSAAASGRDSIFLVVGHAPFVRGNLTQVDLALESDGFRSAEQRLLRGIIVRHYVRSASATSTP